MRLVDTIPGGPDPADPSTAHSAATFPMVTFLLSSTGNLRGRNDRSEKAGNRAQVFSILRWLVVLLDEKSGKDGPILPFLQQINFCRAGS